MTFTRIIMLAAASCLLTACELNPFSDGDADKKPKLVGERLDVTSGPSALAVTPGATIENFAIPAAAALDNWGQTGGNGAHAPGNPAMPASVVRAWTADIGKGDGKDAVLLNVPVVHSGRLFAIDTAGQVTALNATTGKELWSVDLPLKEKEQVRLGGGLAVLGDLLFITTGGGEVFALTASTGKQVWKSDLGVPLRAAPGVDGERVFVLAQDNHLFVLSALDGALVWTHSGMEETLSLVNAATPAIANGVVVAAYTSGEIYVLRETDGRYLWHDTLSSLYSGQDPESTVSGISAEPVVADGIVYTVGLNGGVAAYGLMNGQRFWKTPINSSQMPWVAGYQLFVLTDKGELACLNRKDGAIRWVTDLNADLPKAKDGRVWSGPVLAGDRLIVASTDGYALSITPETGKRKAATEIDNGVGVTPIVAADGLYFQTTNGKIVAFRAGK
ncbi:MAG TPA: PQQ-binding-like beta-propeller repeat protein [Alphaproteobacteria bacterium]|nr:PQQ-binding-like beta-propeller repeat protein [Alphaproteobacteria bacterium]